MMTTTPVKFFHLRANSTERSNCGPRVNLRQLTQHHRLNLSRTPSRVLPYKHVPEQAFFLVSRWVELCGSRESIFRMKHFGSLPRWCDPAKLRGAMLFRGKPIFGSADGKKMRT